MGSVDRVAQRRARVGSAPPRVSPARRSSAPRRPPSTAPTWELASHVTGEVGAAAPCGSDSTDAIAFFRPSWESEMTRRTLDSLPLRRPRSSPARPIAGSPPANRGSGAGAQLGDGQLDRAGPSVPGPGAVSVAPAAVSNDARQRPSRVGGPRAPTPCCISELFRACM